jgi:hypothetical protein
VSGGATDKTTLHTLFSVKFGDYVWEGGIIHGPGGGVYWSGIGSNTGGGYILIAT